MRCSIFVIIVVSNAAAAAANKPTAAAAAATAAAAAATQPKCSKNASDTVKMSLFWICLKSVSTTEILEIIFKFVKQGPARSTLF